MKKQVRLHTAIDRGVLLRKKKNIANINKVHMHRRLTATSSIPLHKQTKLGGGERGEGRGGILYRITTFIHKHTEKFLHCGSNKQRKIVRRINIEYVELCSNMQSCRSGNFGLRNVVKTPQVRWEGGLHHPFPGSLFEALHAVEANLHLESLGWGGREIEKV